MGETHTHLTTDKTPPIPTGPLPEDWLTCLRVLENAVRDRDSMLGLDLETRRRIMEAAGRLSRPDKHEITRLSKERRRKRREEKRNNDRSVRSRAQIRLMRRNPVYVPDLLLPSGASRASRGMLEEERSCYVCKDFYRELHFFYDTMCIKCGDFNYAKRFQSHRLDGKVALITGARVKIGYHAALMMLRAGATVVVTTRFPKDAALRFGRESDFPEWKDRVRVHGLDLRHPGSVERFTGFFTQAYPRLDILINNAAQTVRRPPGFYRHLEENENRSFTELPAPVRSVLMERESWLKSDSAIDSHSHALHAPTPAASLTDLANSHMPSLLPWTEEDLVGREFFPEGTYDADLQQVDLRKINSWRLRLSEVSIPELLEVQLVNSIAPFVLCGRLRALMARTGTGESHIVNVSAMEGKFSRMTKTDKHPHTNMAKAALNMMTLTSAQDYARDGIFMNAVDTGWVTDEDPAEITARKQEELGFEPPLDIVDGAARICDPFFSGLTTGQHSWGIFFKDYRPSAW